MAPRYPRKPLAGSPQSRGYAPPQPYVQPTKPSVQLSQAEIKNLANSIEPIESIAPEPERKMQPVLCYREILMLSRQDVADLFDRIVTSKVKIPILGDPSIIEQQIVDLKSRIGIVEELLATRSAAWQKCNRPEDRLSSDDLERLKYHEKKEVKTLRVQIRELQDRLRTWGTHKEDYTSEREEFVDMTFDEKHPDLILSETTPVFGWIPRVSGKRVRNTKGGFDVVEVIEVSAGGFHDEIDTRYNSTNYRKLMPMGDDALELISSGMTWENWTRWENAAICVAISEGLIKPDLEIVSRHPALSRWTVVPEDESDHEEERAQILKTGGGSLGGATIYSRGWRYGRRNSWTRRALESFDATARARLKPEDTDARENYTDLGPPMNSGWIGDDAESYDPR
jgi:hypothetical protein